MDRINKWRFLGVEQNTVLECKKDKRNCFMFLSEQKDGWKEPKWAIPGDRIEKIPDPSRGSVLTVHYYDSEDGVCRTAFAGVSGQQHECREHSVENAWKFISQFTK